LTEIGILEILKPKVFVREGDNNELVKKEVKTLDDVIKYVPFRSFVKLLITVSKFWVKKTGKDRECGLTLKVKQIEVTKTAKSGSDRNAFEEYALGDDVEEKQDDNNAGNEDLNPELTTVDNNNAEEKPDENADDENAENDAEDEDGDDANDAEDGDGDES